MRACRRETFASGSSESKSTSGNTPPSASQRPMFDSAPLRGNFLPADIPRSMTRLACVAGGDSKDATDLCSPERCVPLCTRLAAGLGEFPFEPLPGVEGNFPDFPAIQSAAPQTSQKREPSRFSVLHRSQTIIESVGGPQLIRWESS